MMEIDYITKAILHLCPNAQFVTRGDDIEWMDENYNQPKDSEIKETIELLKKEEIKQANDLIAARQSVLDKLGISEDEARLLLG